MVSRSDIMYQFLCTVVYLFSFALAFLGVSSIQFEKFCTVKKPVQVQILCFCLSMALGYFVAQFLLMFIVGV